MAENLNKLQIRAKTLAVLSDIKARKPIDIVSEQLDFLKTIEDKDCIFEVLIKEFQKAPDEFLMIIKIVMADILPLNYLQDKIMNIILEQKTSDSYKYQLLLFLKDAGFTVDYQKISTCFDNFEEVLEKDTKVLLEAAIVNPETQIDFLDFLISLPNDDKLILINSLSEDYTGDNLANVLTPILYADFDKDVLETVIANLGETKSSIGLEAIRWLIDTTKNEDIKNICKKSLTMLKLAGASDQKAKEFYLAVLSKSSIYKCYTTIPDGHSNQGFIISRFKEDDAAYQLVACVINHNTGFVDCFGFNTLSLSEFERIITRFSKYEPKIVVSPEYCKFLIEKSLLKTVENNARFPYEFVCWNILMKDIPNVQFDFQEFIDSNFETKNIEPEDLKSFYQKDYIDKWFITVADNNNFNKLIDEIVTQENITIEEIEKFANESFKKIFDINTVKDFKERILNSSYLIYEFICKEDAEILYSITQNEDTFEKFKLDILQKSIYEHFIITRQNIKDVAGSTNIFKLKREKSVNKEQLVAIESIIKLLEDNWAK